MSNVFLRICSNFKPRCCNLYLTSAYERTSNTSLIFSASVAPQISKHCILSASGSVWCFVSHFITRPPFSSLFLLHVLFPMLFQALKNLKCVQRYRNQVPFCVSLGDCTKAGHATRPFGRLFSFIPERSSCVRVWHMFNWPFSQRVLSENKSPTRLLVREELVDPFSRPDPRTCFP